MSNRPFRRLRRPAAVVAAVSALALSVSTLSASSAAAPAQPTVIDKGLVSPLSVAVNDDNVVYYSANFAGQLYRKAPGKPAKVVYQSKGGKEVGAISTVGKTVYFVSGFNLMKLAKGKVTKVAALGAYEKENNPDAEVSYGLVDPAAECLEAWPTGDEAPPAQYTGIVEAHPYGTAVVNGTVYVADAAANAILAVKGGKITTAAVLPAVPVEITEELATQYGIPEVCIGETYNFEGVPTDVEAGPEGMLYVSGLPGGEIPGKGYVATVDPESGETTELASGLVAAAGLAVLPNGTVYVSQLFAGEITKIAPNGSRSTFAGAPLPSAVEVKGKKLYATINVLAGLEPGQKPGGKVVSYLR
ncbi:streptogramin lyase [Nocardioides thalensis]|uniref:Streptogramin lyase n=1 Tax=Nocardioides thalensis TaxID=1914755 RepID=A0A853C8M0_9ACTN|nr:streptogramin lyase [Nocardioides thalensis]